MKFSIDTNVLVYSVTPDDRRAQLAGRIMRGAVATQGVLTNQALGEFLNVVRTKKVISLDEGRLAAADWALLFHVLPTSSEHLLAASTLFERHRIQFRDAVILTVCQAAGVEYLLTEDMGDGKRYDGVTVVNPFNPTNAGLVDLLLTPAP